VEAIPYLYCDVDHLIICIYFIFPETKGRNLEEMAEIFDGVDASVVHDIQNMEDLKIPTTTRDDEVCSETGDKGCSTHIV
jgi:hypothetical protein